MSSLKPTANPDAVYFIRAASAAARKEFPIATGVIDYFPDALAMVALVSKRGNDQHNPGQPLHWARGKSTDQADTIARHLLDRGTLDTDGVFHSAKVAWRALAAAQEEIEVFVREHGAHTLLQLLGVEPSPIGQGCGGTLPVEPAYHFDALRGLTDPRQLDIFSLGMYMAVPENDEDHIVPANTMPPDLYDF